MQPAPHHGPGGGRAAGHRAVRAERPRRREEEQPTLEEAERAGAGEVDLEPGEGDRAGPEGWHPGVIGIVRLSPGGALPPPGAADRRHRRAGQRVRAKHRRPSTCGRRCDACAPLLTRFGGHHYAAGLRRGGGTALPELRRRINEVADATLTHGGSGAADRGGRGGRAVVELSLEAVTRSWASWHPAGWANPAAVADGAAAAGGGDDARWASGAHVSLRLREQAGQVDGRRYGSGRANCANRCLRGRWWICVVGRRLDTWNGNTGYGCSSRTSRFGGTAVSGSGKGAAGRCRALTKDKSARSLPALLERVAAYHPRLRPRPADARL